MVATAIQLHTLRSSSDPLPAVLRQVDEAGFDGVEFAPGNRSADVEAVREALSATGLAVPAVHVAIDDLIEDFEWFVKYVRALSADRIVLPELDRGYFETAASTRETGYRLESLADELAEHGLSLSYHNHAAEFVSREGTCAFDVLADATEAVTFEFDVGLAAWAGADPVDVLDRHRDRIDLVHCSDANLSAAEPGHVRFGTGDVDYESVFAAIGRAEVDWLCYENGMAANAESELAHAAEAFVDRLAADEP